MRKIQDVIGLPVLDVSSGKKVGTVSDFFFNRAGELKGITVALSHGLMTKIKYLPFENIGAIGDDAVTIGSVQFLTPYIPNDLYFGFESGSKTYKELPVFTTNGYELGHIEDVYFMEEVGKIIGYELSDGFLSDITEGRKTIKVPQRMVLGDDAMIIPRHEIKEVEFAKEALKEE